MLVKKLGQPVPDSNFISEVNSGSPQPAQTNTPARFSAFSGLVPGRSVSSSRSTLKLLPGRRLRHSSLDSFNGSSAEGTVVPAARKVFQSRCIRLMSFTSTGCAARARNGTTVSPVRNIRRFIETLLPARFPYFVGRAGGTLQGLATIGDVVGDGAA